MHVFLHSWWRDLSSYRISHASPRAMCDMDTVLVIPAILVACKKNKTLSCFGILLFFYFDHSLCSHSLVSSLYSQSSISLISHEYPIKTHIYIVVNAFQSSLASLTTFASPFRSSHNLRGILPTSGSSRPRPGMLITSLNSFSVIILRTVILPLKHLLISGAVYVLI